MPGAPDAAEQVRRDARFMRNALAMARRGLGLTAPNPSVGAVIVDHAGVIIARGVTQPGGRPHAERVALEKAGDLARGATLYVTLEPCSHHGKTPPCADAVIEAGIRRVVCGIADPHDVVAGQGLARLRAAGIDVTENVLAQEARWVTLGHILRVTQRRPFVQLKLALSRDGRIAAGSGAPVWVTGEEARARGHLLRAQVDAILVGIGTVIADDPSLDCRLPGLEERSPRVFVLDSRCRLPRDCRLMRRATAPIVVSGCDGNESAEEEVRALALMSAGADVWGLPVRGEVPLDRLMREMAQAGFTRLLVEGGPHIWRSFLDADLADEIVVFEGQGELGEAGLLPFVDHGIERLGQVGRFEEVDRRAVGGDKMRLFRRKA